jgi:hypothetical protein
MFNVLVSLLIDGSDTTQASSVAQTYKVVALQ